MNERSPRQSSVEVVPGGPVHGSLKPPGSKSLTNRALICSAFTRAPCRIVDALRSEDTLVMIDALRAIGVQIDCTGGGRVIDVDPTGRKRSPEELELFIGNSGTSVRFLTAALSAFGGRYRIAGIEKMHERPIGDLVRAIEPVIDGQIVATSPGDCPPVEIDSRGWNGTRIEVAGNVSSQYLSGLMMAAPIALSEQTTTTLTIRVRGELISVPYVHMTAAVMKAFGAQVNCDDLQSIHIDSNPYQATEYRVEPDASAASYFWAAPAIAGGTVTVRGLSRSALQGDVGFCEVLRKMGCQIEYETDAITVTAGPLRGIDVDMNAISDTVQTLAVVALFADGPTRVRGVAHNRFKETDRIGDLAIELRKFGAVVDEHDDGLTIHPPSDLAAVGNIEVETYDDHRMAMSLALVGLRIPGVKILNPACTAKTYPEFFADLERLLGRPHLWRSPESRQPSLKNA